MEAVTWQIFEGDCRAVLHELPARMVQTVVTSPPYFGLRDYGTSEWDGGDIACDHRGPPAASATASTLKNDGRPIDKIGQNNYERQAGAVYRDVCRKCGARRVDRQIGLEPTPDEFVAALVEVFREVRRVLRDDGTVWLNLGDSYASDFKGSGGTGKSGLMNDGREETQRLKTADASNGRAKFTTRRFNHGAKPKDLLGIPWMVAFALRADGWYLRSDIIWSKPNPMPESVTDRPTKSHEYLFLLSKGPRYFYDADAIREADTGVVRPNFDGQRGTLPGSNGRSDAGGDAMDRAGTHPAGRNKRSVWQVATAPFPGQHFATFPPKLIEPCILAGTSPKACGVCGAPWRSVVERTPMVVRPSERREGWQERDGDLVRTQTGGTMIEPPTSRTVGWEPSCAHQDDTGRSVVLDPFAGSGTTGVVAGQLQRDFIGIELNPEYAAMARERILVEGKPGQRNHEPAKVHEDQLGLI